MRNGITFKGGDFVMEEMDMSVTTIEYFKAMSDESGIPYQVLMNYYLDDCVRQQKKLRFVGEPASASI